MALVLVACSPAATKPPMMPGCVLLAFRLDAERKPVDVHVLKSNPPGLYDDLAVESVRKAHYPQPPSKPGDKPYSLVLNFYDEHHPHAPMPSCKLDTPAPAAVTQR
jgi:hypothetical protein